MGSTSTNEGVGLKVGLCMKWTMGSPSLMVRRNALEAFSCCREVFQLGRLEKRGSAGQVPRPSANFSVVRSTVGYLRFKRRRCGLDSREKKMKRFNHQRSSEFDHSK